MDFLKANWLVIVVTLIGALFVCGLLGYLLIGSMFTPGAMMNPGNIVGMLGKFTLFGLLAGTLIYAAVLSIYRHGLTNGQDGIGTHIGWALLGGFLLTLVYVVAFIALYLVLIVILMSVVGFSPSAMQAGSSGMAAMGAGALVFMLLFYLFLLWLMSRLTCVAPSMAKDKDSNPFTAIGKSWNMTASSQWTIFGFMILLFVASFVVGLIAGALGSVGSILLLIFYIAYMLFSVAMPAGIFKELSPDNSAEVFN